MSGNSIFPVSLIHAGTVFMSWYLTSFPPACVISNCQKKLKTKMFTKKIKRKFNCFVLKQKKLLCLMQERFNLN